MAQQRRPATKRSKSTAHIDDLSGFLKDMGVIPSEMKRAEQVFMTIAAATVVAEAKQHASTQGRQQQSAATTLRQLGAGIVQYGGTPWAMGAEFGSILYGQFPEWRGNKEDAGYFFWPAVRDFRDEEMINLWVREVWEVVEGLFSG
jgi:hypothetical protein